MRNVRRKSVKRVLLGTGSRQRRSVSSVLTRTTTSGACVIVARTIDNTSKRPSNERWRGGATEKAWCTSRSILLSDGLNCTFRPHRTSGVDVWRSTARSIWAPRRTVPAVNLVAASNDYAYSCLLFCSYAKSREYHVCKVLIRQNVIGKL